MTDDQVLRLEDETFDLGTSTFGLMFFPDPPAGLRELRRVPRPSGRAGIAAWDMMRMGLPQLIGAALARAVPDLMHPHRRRGRICVRRRGWKKLYGRWASPTSRCIR